MTLSPGTRLGPYEIIGPLGAGGMGEVYRARDARLERDVAVKVLTATLSRDPDMLRRFGVEAKAVGALSHPNIMAVFDVGEHEGAPYVVCELLSGETLRTRLFEGPLKPRLTRSLALQIAGGLAAAHERGIVHRDLKPENLFLTDDDRIKILDFGLAKLMAGATLEEDATGAIVSDRTGTQPDAVAGTQPGMVLGTIGYMSPEQVRGRTVDHRSDIFAFGAVVYEMLSGRRAFKGDTPADTLSAILKEDPPELPEALGGDGAGLERIARRCLEKRPEQRFHSAADVAFALEAIAGTSERSVAPLPAPVSASVSQASAVGRRQPGRGLAIAIVLLALCTGAAYLLGKRAAAPPLVNFHRLTFRAGFVSAARFAPDPQTVVYAAGWEGSPFAVFTTRSDSPESRALDLPDADLMAVSATGEMAVLLGTRRNWFRGGTLARASLAGSAPRQVQEDVLWADWSKTGELATVRRRAGHNLLEMPIGTTLVDAAGAIRFPRVSPDGGRIAFFESQGMQDSLRVVERASGHASTLGSGWRSVTGLAWSSDSDEVWFSASDGASAPAIRATTLGGKQRIVLRTPAPLALLDVARDGRVLLAQSRAQAGILWLDASDQERDLSWMDWSVAQDVSDDGQSILFDEEREGGGEAGAVYFRHSDDATPVRLGEGEAQALSADTRWALALRRGSSPELVMLPTGPGTPITFKGQGVAYSRARFFPDGKHILATGQEPGHARRLYIQDLVGGKPLAVTPEGVGTGLVSPDGAYVLAPASDRSMTLYPVAGGEPRKIPGLSADDTPIAWSSDGTAVFVYKRGELPARVVHVSVATGERRPWKELMPNDTTGVTALSVLMTPDGKSYVYSVQRTLSDLYVAEGLR